MMAADSILADLVFTLSNLSLPQVIDLALVTFIFYTLFVLLRRSRATVLLRGTLIVVLFFFIFTVFLPLPTFDYLIQVALIAILVAVPIIFQPELRYLLEELGRSVGNLNLQRQAAEVTQKPLVRAIESLSSNQIGALIVLEGEDDLGGILETGVPVGSEVTSELLQTIFYDGTPLHDGALIIRGRQIQAAGCVLPVSNRQLYAGERRLGTRHRAAVGLTETSDSLVLVVSEETGHISTARHGKLQTDVDKTVVREQIHSFYRSDQTQSDTSFSWKELLARSKEWWGGGDETSNSRRLLSNLGLLFMALLFALSAWAFVLEQTDAIQQRTISGIPLRVTNVPQGTRLLSAPPQTVSAVVRAGNQILPSLDPTSFEAYTSLEGLGPGLHRLAVQVDPSVDPVQVLAIRPGELDLRLEQIITRSVPVEVVTTGETSLSPAFEVRQLPEADPDAVEVVGATSDVEKVVSARAELSVAEASGSIQRVQTVSPVDANGLVVSDVEVRPEQVQVSVVVERRADARQAGVRVETEGQLPEGYRLSRFLVSPAQVTLLGEPSVLADVENAISTLPVDLSNAADDLQIQVPLNLPPGIEAVNSYGETVRSVLVQLEVSERVANRVFSRRVEIQGATGVTLTVVPAQVDVTLSGAVPLLNDVSAEPQLIRVFVDAASLADLEPGESVMVVPQVSKPEPLKARLFPEEVEVRATP